jgi:hypothetical protein
MMSNEVAVPSVALDHMSSVYLEYMEVRKTMDILAKQKEKLETQLRDAVGEHEQATIMGEVVITNRPTKTFKAKDLERDNPNLYKEYVRLKYVEVFDKDTFAVDHPNLYTQYQSRQFLFKEAK